MKIITSELFEDMHRALIGNTEAFRATALFMAGKGLDAGYLSAMVEINNGLLDRIDAFDEEAGSDE